jgi:hypothetical protein
MLKLPVYLYPNTFELLLDLDDNQRIHNIMYQRDLTIQKGVKNKIQLQFKNSDQKPVPVSSSSFKFTMFDRTNQRKVIEKDITVLDDGTTATRGLAVLNLLEGDTWGIDCADYQFSVQQYDSTDNTYTPAYANTYYGMAGTLHLQHDLMPALQKSVVVTHFQKNLNRDPGAQRYEFDSGNLAGNPSFHHNGEYHTMAVYMTNYTGWLYLQGSMDNTPPPSGAVSTYADIESRYYTRFTGIVYFNYQGVWSYSRLRYVPDIGPYPGLNDQTQYTGTVDKLLYRS